MCYFCVRDKEISRKNGHYYLGEIVVNFCPKCGRDLKKYGFDFTEEEAIRVIVRGFSLNEEIKVSNKTTVEEIANKYNIKGRISLDGVTLKPEDHKKMIRDFTSEESCYIQQLYKVVPQNGVISVVYG